MYIGQAFSLDPISKSSVLTPVKPSPILGKIYFLRPRLPLVISPWGEETFVMKIQNKAFKLSKFSSFLSTQFLQILVPYQRCPKNIKFFREIPHSPKIPVTSIFPRFSENSIISNQFLRFFFRDLQEKNHSHSRKMGNEGKNLSSEHWQI